MSRKPNLFEGDALRLLQKAPWPLLPTYKAPNGSLLTGDCQYVTKGPKLNLNTQDSSVRDSHEEHKDRDDTQRRCHCNCSAPCLQGSTLM